MTLDTRVRIVDPLPPEDVFAFARSLIGATDEHKHNRREGCYLGITSLIMEPGQGLSAWLMVDWHPDGPFPREDDEPDAPDACIEVSFDTGYGYSDDQGRGCSALHRELTAKLGEWLDDRRADWWAYDEFAGEWHHRTPCPVTP